MRHYDNALPEHCLIEKGQHANIEELHIKHHRVPWAMVLKENNQCQALDTRVKSDRVDARSDQAHPGDELVAAQPSREQSSEKQPKVTTHMMNEIQPRICSTHVLDDLSATTTRSLA